MWVKALEDFDCPTHHLAKGKFGDMLAHYAEAGIKAGQLAPASVKDWQASLVETRPAKPKRSAPKETTTTD